MYHVDYKVRPGIKAVGCRFTHTSSFKPNILFYIMLNYIVEDIAFLDFEHFLEVLEVPISDSIAIRELSNAVIILFLLRKRKF